MEAFAAFIELSSHYLFRVMKKFTKVRFEVFMEVSMKNAVFWDVAPCRSCVNQRSSEISVHTRSTRRHIP
jgi:hypothetical protein